MRANETLCDTVVVVGANGEICLQLCGELSKLGVNVIAVTRKKLSSLFETVEKSGKIFNVSIEINQKNAIREILGLDQISVSKNLGLVYGPSVFKRIKDFRDIEIEDWDEAIQVNLKSAFLWNQIFGEHAISLGKQLSIVNISSQAAYTGGYGEVFPYAASKGGLETMTRSFARVLGPSGIRVNAIAPGFVDTKSMRGSLSEPELQQFLNRVALGRLSTINEVVQPIIFLLSEGSAYITGTTMNVTGGQLLY
jgi:3-oxoacyl-[acyl-carrier protein] reductase